MALVRNKFNENISSVLQLKITKIYCPLTAFLSDGNDIGIGITF